MTEQRGTGFLAWFDAEDWLYAAGDGPGWEHFDEAAKEIRALTARVAELEAALGRAQEVIHSEWCSGTYHAEPCRDATAALEKNSSRPKMSGICSLHRDGEDPTCRICYDKPESESVQNRQQA